MTLGRPPHLCALWTPELRTRRGRAGGWDFLLLVTFDGSGSPGCMGMTAQFPLADGCCSCDFLMCFSPLHTHTSLGPIFRSELGGCELLLKGHGHFRSEGEKEAGGVWLFGDVWGKREGSCEG